MARWGLGFVCLVEGAGGNLCRRWMCEGRNEGRKLALKDWRGKFVAAYYACFCGGLGIWRLYASFNVR